MAAGGSSIDLTREFPCFKLSVSEHAPASASHAIVIDVGRWRAEPFDASAFDRALATARPLPARVVHLVAGGSVGIGKAAIEVMTRYQHLADRRNVWSSSAWFDRVLSLLESLHDKDDPLRKADWQHALDTWQWLLRLKPDASAALQIAALFHDVERSISRPGSRLEQKRADASVAGAEIVESLLSDIGALAPIVGRAAELVRNHHRADTDAALTLLNDADALSFFSRESAGFFAFFGREHTRDEISRSLARLSSRRWPLLATIRFAPQIAQSIAEFSRNAIRVGFRAG